MSEAAPATTTATLPTTATTPAAATDSAATDSAATDAAATDTATARLTHLDESGQAHMVDVSRKDVTVRTATASGKVLLSADAVAALRDGTVPKGDALAVARIAGIQAAKRTPDLIPLCHPLGLHGVSVDLTVTDQGVDITAAVKTADRTGVEMEALTSVSVAALALIDMIKSVDKAAVVTDVRIDTKDGGKSGPWRHPASRPHAPAGQPDDPADDPASQRAEGEERS